MKTRILKIGGVVITAAVVLFGFNIALLLDGQRPLAIGLGTADDGGSGFYLGFLSHYDIDGHLDTEKGYIIDDFTAGLFGIPVINVQNKNGDR